jgi:hypothetical protein
MAKNPTVDKTPAELAVETFQAISAKLMTWAEAPKPTAESDGGNDDDGGASPPSKTSSPRSRVEEARPKVAKGRAKPAGEAPVTPATASE